MKKRSAPCIDCAVELGRSRRTCTNIRATISTFLRFCRRNRWEYVQLEDDDLHIPNKAAPAKEKHVLHDEDIRVLFNDPYMVKHCRKEIAHFIHAWRFFVVTGLRRGELVGLKHEDIFDGKIHIRRSINTEGEETHGKNDNARRTFAITSNMQAILNDQADFMKEKGIESPWVFPDWYGERTVPHALYSSWRAYSKQHGIECTIHELRHTFVSLNKADLPLELLKAVVGHSSSMDTIGVYGHEVDGDQARTAAIMDDVINKKLHKTQ